MHHQGFVPSWPCWLLYHHQKSLSVCTQLWHKVPAWPCLATTLLLIKFVSLSCLYVCLHVSPTAPLWPFLPTAFSPDKFVCVCSCMCKFVSITQQVCLCSCMCKFLSITQQICLSTLCVHTCVSFYLSPGSAAPPCLATTSLTDRCVCLTFH